MPVAEPVLMSSRHSRLGKRCQILVCQCDHGGALADSASHAFNGARSDVAYREDAACLTRKHEAVCVKGNTAVREPFGLGIGAHEEKDVSYRSRFLRAVTTFSPGHAIEMTSSIGVKARELGMDMQRYVLRRGNAIDQVTGHAGGQARPAYEHVNPGRMVG